MVEKKASKKAEASEPTPEALASALQQEAGESKPKAKSKVKAKLLMYKGKPFVRQGNVIYYGNPTDKYIVTFTLEDFKQVKDLQVAQHVTIVLQKNDEYLSQKNKMIKKAERDCLWSAIDIGAFWLEDALEQG